MLDGASAESAGVWQMIFPFLHLPDLQLGFRYWYIDIPTPLRGSKARAVIDDRLNFAFNGR
jgi:hypothetical protein